MEAEQADMNTNAISIHEVGPRDGLQVEKEAVPLQEKIRWIDALMDSGIDIIQLGSFVHPVKVPQMADTDKLFAHYSAQQGAAKRAVLSAWGCQPAILTARKIPA